MNYTITLDIDTTKIDKLDAKNPRRLMHTMLWIMEDAGEINFYEEKDEQIIITCLSENEMVNATTRCEFAVEQPIMKNAISIV